MNISEKKLWDEIHKENEQNEEELLNLSVFER